MNAVWDLDLPHTAKIVLLRLADHADRHGHCWPGLPSLARSCGMNYRTVRRQLQHLESGGYVVIRRSGGVVNRYELNLATRGTESGVDPGHNALTPGAESPGYPGQSALGPGAHNPPNHQEPSIEPPKNRTVRFAPPTEEEAKLHAAKIGLPDTEVTRFMNHYGSNGWMVGKNKMKDWHCALVNWRENWRNGRYASNGKPAERPKSIGRRDFERLLQEPIRDQP